MSRAYRLSVFESLNRVVQAEDGVCSQLELLPLLSPEELGGLLSEELVRRGFTLEQGIALRTEPDGVRVAIDPRTGGVSITLSDERAVELSARAEETYGDGRTREHAQARAEERARGKLDTQVQKESEQLRQDVTERLERRLRDLKQELDGVTNRVTAEALKVRAGQLGTVEEVHEDVSTGSLTIKVRL